MYLTAEIYVSGYNENHKVCHARILEAVGLEPTDLASPEQSLTVDVTVAYWRKANQIHSWFVQNVQNGVDNCERFFVDEEKLTELRDLCKKVLDSKSEDVARELLEPKSGFFFGSTTIDEWYWENLETTVKALDKVLTNPKFEGCSFYYRASW